MGNESEFKVKNLQWSFCGLQISGISTIKPQFVLVYILNIPYDIYFKNTIKRILYGREDSKLYNNSKNMTVDWCCNIKELQKQD